MVKASSLWIGKSLGPDYQLRRFRGRGAFGSVWEAVNAEGKLVALKLLPCDDPMVAAQEIRAIQVVNHLRHPNLTPIDQVWCYRGYIVVTMPLADGSLQDLLEAYKTEYGTALPPEQLCPMMCQAAAGLDFLNTKQHTIDGSLVSIQHRDVKPSNMLLYGETVKLCDFSLAAPTNSLLKPRRKEGTPDYASPEQFRGMTTDHTDQYSLGITYCELRGGRLPFPPPSRLDPHHVRPAPDLSMLGVGERPIIARALASTAHDRWPSCTEMMARLSRVNGVAVPAPTTDSAEHKVVAR